MSDTDKELTESLPPKDTNPTIESLYALLRTVASDVAALREQGARIEERAERLEGRGAALDRTLADTASEVRGLRRYVLDWSATLNRAHGDLEDRIEKLEEAGR